MTKWKMTSAMKKRIERVTLELWDSQQEVPRFLDIVAFCRTEKLHDPSREACVLIRSWIVHDNKKLRCVGAEALADFWQDLRDFKDTSKKIVDGMKRLSVLSKIGI
ncbi:hypothetical protein LCGC14_1651710 [marine sediment metagenome]|uniref:Uncharacterized protein n=1 Tax=marine sediment metagenome TaxID=412755 RepID=A0A0F9KCE9_9ZZZZ